MTNEPARLLDLDLVRQHGDARYETGRLVGLPDEAETHDRAEALFDRIAALVAQQPIQARDEAGLLVWQDGCGSIATAAGFPSLRRCPECNTDATWRPLLVDGDPALERDPLLCPTCDSPQPSMHPAVGGGGEVTALCVDRFHAVPSRPDRCLCGYVEAGQAGNCVCGFTDPNDIQGWRNRYADPQPDLVAQVMAELGVTDPADVLISLGKRFGALILARKSREHWRGMYDAAVKAMTKEHDQLDALKAVFEAADDWRNTLERIPPGAEALMVAVERVMTVTE